ncbi:G patch domain-containing protein 4, variant 2 [Homalodisca vitripennis]|nr:G patch domain-containing protein 4, variant 2 [Homalodisca vitripennis]
MGYDHSMEFTDHWWENIYNNALSATTIQDGEEQNSPGIHQRKKTEKKKRIGSDNLYEACEGRTAHKRVYSQAEHVPSSVSSVLAPRYWRSGEVT